MQVLNIVFFSDKTTPGGFFPNGVNGMCNCWAQMCQTAGIPCSINPDNVVQATKPLQAPPQHQPTNGVLLPADDQSRFTMCPQQTHILLECQSQLSYLFNHVTIKQLYMTTTSDCAQHVDLPTHVVMFVVNKTRML